MKRLHLLSVLPLLLCLGAPHVDAATWSFQTDAEGRRMLAVCLPEGETSLDVPSVWDGEPVTAIASEAFAVCDGLREVRIPASVEYIAPDAFRRCPTLENLFVDESNPSYSDIDGVLFDASGTYLLTCPEGREGDYVIPTGTIEVDAAAFRACAGLTSVTVPSGVQDVGAGAFADCLSLAILSVPKGFPLDAASLSLDDTCRIVRYTPATSRSGPEPSYWEAEFIANGGVGTMPGQSFSTGVFAALADCAFTRAGHTFAGWSRTVDGAVEFSDGQSVTDLAMPGESLRLYAVWTANRYTVRFSANGGSGTMQDEPFQWGARRALLANAFTRKGYSFAGWSRTKGGAVEFTNRQSVMNLVEAPDGVVTLYAVWKGIVYTVVFHSGTSPEKTKKQSFRYGSRKALRANSFKRSGYVFIGWSKKPSGTLFKKNSAVVANLTSVAGKKVHLYALWAVRKYKVAFRANGGTGTMRNQAFVYGKAKALSTNAFKRNGYTLVGWAKKSSGPVKYTDGQSVKNLTKKGGVVTLHAIWRRNRYKVRFDANGGKGTMAVQTFSWGIRKKLSRCTFTRSKCTFRGWATTPSGAVAYADAAAVKSLTKKDGKTITLYARWAKTNYSVKFDPNGGVGAMANLPLTWGTKERLPANVFSLDGYRFLGWSKDPTATSPTYRDGDTVLNLTAKGIVVVLYAVWIEENDPDVILCLGDSITQGYACYGLPYPARLARMTGCTVINKGVGGTTSGDGLRTAERNIYEARAATVCIQFGANDAIHHVNAGATKENLRAIIRLCRKYDCRPLLATPTHQSGSHARFNDGVNDIVRAVRNLAREENVALVDLNAAFGGNDGYLNPNDGLHLSDAGGELMARKFYEAL